MKGRLTEDHFTPDGALYRGDIVTIQSTEQVTESYRVQTRLGKILSVPQSKVRIVSSRSNRTSGY